MKQSNRNWLNKYLCILVVIVVLISLVVRPFADTLNLETSVGDILTSNSETIGYTPETTEGEKAGDSQEGINIGTDGQEVVEGAEAEDSQESIVPDEGNDIQGSPEGENSQEGIDSGTDSQEAAEGAEAGDSQGSIVPDEGNDIQGSPEGESSQEGIDSGTDSQESINPDEGSDSQESIVPDEESDSQGSSEGENSQEGIDSGTDSQKVSEEAEAGDGQVSTEDIKAEEDRKSSDEAIEEEDLEGSDEDIEKDGEEETEKEVASQRKEFSYEDESIIVTALFSEAAAIPSDAEFSVTPITKENSSNQYNEIDAMVSEKVKAENKEVTDFLAYDIKFITNDGMEYEPEKGTVTVTISYKNKIFNDEVMKITEGIQVLHLEETDSGILVKNVTEEVEVSDIGGAAGNKTEETEAADTAAAGDNIIDPGTGTSDIGAETDNTDNSDNTDNADKVQFVTESFSTFVVTGIGTLTNASIKVSMKFLKTDNQVDTSINETYYLNVTGPSDYRYNLTLKVENGIVNATIPGLYDASGNMNNGSLYRLQDGSYTAVLFKYPTAPPANFKWDLNYPTNVPGCVEYTTGSELAENYYLSSLPGSVSVSNGSGDFQITASARSGIQFSRSDIWNALTPVRDYGVFANTMNLTGDMEGNIAVKQINISNNFGNSDKNRTYYTYTNFYTLYANKTYHGTTAKTFTYGLFDSAGILISTADITLPSNGVSSGSTSFNVKDTVNNYTVRELGENNAPLDQGTSYNGYKLTGITEGSVETKSSVISSTSYIETIGSIDPNAKTPLRDGTATQKNNLVLGSQYTISNDGSNTYVSSGATQLFSAKTAYCNISKAVSTFPIEFAATLQQMEALSINLAQAVTSDTVMVKNMTIAELNAKNQAGLTYNTSGRMLLLNIDATGQESEISLFANAKLLVNNTLAVDPNSSNSSAGAWCTEANNVIVNIYTKSGDTYSAYTGKINNAGYVMGTLLVPRARVISLGQSFNGCIVADYVTNGSAEVHGNTIGIKTESKTYTFVNSELPVIILPSTGSIGICFFYTLGGSLTLLAFLLMAAFFIKGRQKHNQEVP